MYSAYNNSRNKSNMPDIHLKDILGSTQYDRIVFMWRTWIIFFSYAMWNLYSGLSLYSASQKKGKPINQVNFSEN